MNAIEIEDNSAVNGNDFANILRENKVITKATKNYICRLTPALNITKQEVDEVVAIIEQSVHQMEALNE